MMPPDWFGLATRYFSLLHSWLYTNSPSAWHQIESRSRAGALVQNRGSSTRLSALPGSIPFFGYYRWHQQLEPITCTKYGSAQPLLAVIE